MKNKISGKVVRTVSAVGAGVGTLSIAALSPDLLESSFKMLSEASQSEFAKNCFIFSLAAAVHSGRVKKEIRSAVETLTHSLTLSIEKVAEAFRDDLKNHSEKLDNLASRVASLESQNLSEQTKEK